MPEKYVRSLGDACDESAARLNVVIEMLANHDCPAKEIPKDDEDAARNDNGGYDLVIARRALVEIRDLLQDSIAAYDEQRQKVLPHRAQAPGGAYGELSSFRDSPA